MSSKLSKSKLTDPDKKVKDIFLKTFHSLTVFSQPLSALQPGFQTAAVGLVTPHSTG